MLFGKVGLSIGLWFVSEGAKKIELDMVSAGDIFADTYIALATRGQQMFVCASQLMQIQICLPIVSVAPGE